MNQSIAELYLQAADKWCDLENAANLLEDTKSAIFSQMVLRQNASSVAKAELLVRGSAEWLEHVERIVAARTAANRADIQRQYWKMRGWEESSKAADNRLQARI